MHKNRRERERERKRREGEGENTFPTVVGSRILLHHPVSHGHGRSFNTGDGLIPAFFGKLDMGMKLVLSFGGVIVIVCSVLGIIVELVVLQ